MAYKVAWADHVVIVTFDGATDIREINEANGGLHGDARFDDLQLQIFDFLEADLSSVLERDAAQPAATDMVAAGFTREMKVASVARDPHTVVVCNEYIERSKSYGIAWEFGVFSCVDDAMAWGQPAD